MKYTEVTFELNPLIPAREVLVAELADLGFDSFVETETGIQAYIPSSEFSENLLKALMTSDMEDQKIAWTIVEMPDQNWNAEWEKNFEPIIVDDKCLIRAPFHKDLPAYELEIEIEPKMSFGTGHHATTYLIVAELMSMELNGLSVLDMGSGTGVLAIAAEKRGAAACDAIDIDEWAFENATENCLRNQCKYIHCVLGGAEVIPDQKYYDLILANINRNILMRDLPVYDHHLRAGSEILLSGFYAYDKTDLHGQATTLGWQLIGEKTRNEWCMLRYRKN
ncbi:MAG: 50S ribosomal protein L11 methyltransferase [Flavobacteriales bacterium]